MRRQSESQRQSVLEDKPRRGESAGRVLGEIAGGGSDKPDEVSREARFTPRRRIQGGRNHAIKEGGTTSSRGEASTRATKASARKHVPGAFGRRKRRAAAS
jgi:hypothetical protein